MPNYSIFLKLKANIRFSIAEYLKYAYKLVQILGEPDTNSIVAIDETLITHHDGWKSSMACRSHWNWEKDVRLDIIQTRNSENHKNLYTII